MNELTRMCLDVTKATNGLVITKDDFLQVVTPVFLDGENFKAHGYGG